jgi:hypothetical protein
MLPSVVSLAASLRWCDVAHGGASPHRHPRTPREFSIQLTSGTTYWFVVTAWNVDGDSEPSAAVSSAKQ